MKRNKEYWKKRCELAEDYISKSPCDPDITRDQSWAYAKWQSFVNHNSNLPWFDAPPPPLRPITPVT